MPQLPPCGPRLNGPAHQIQFLAEQLLGEILIADANDTHGFQSDAFICPIQPNREQQAPYGLCLAGFAREIRHPGMWSTRPSGCSGRITRHSEAGKVRALRAGSRVLGNSGLMTRYLERAVGPFNVRIVLRPG